MLITVIGRGHSGTRAMSHTLTASGVFMGEPRNASGDLLPADPMYRASRIVAKHVRWLGGTAWDFSALETAPIPDEFVACVEEYLAGPLASRAERRGWKLPETTLCYPWIRRMFPEARYVFWVRNPRDCILGRHGTDDLSTWGIGAPPTDDLRRRRAHSWLYQYELVKASPRPKHSIDVRFEDFVLDQERTLARLEAFFGFPLARIPVNPEATARHASDRGRNHFDFLEPAMRECGYEIPPPDAPVDRRAPAEPSPDGVEPIPPWGLQTFRDVPIMPYSALLEQKPEGFVFHRGGPVWPDWDRQVTARYCHSGRPVDLPPVPLPIEDTIDEPLAWGGPVHRHFGHQIADFSTRLLPTLESWPDAVFAFGVGPKVRARSPADAPRFFTEILAWYGIPIDRVRWLDRPTLARCLLVAPQAEIQRVPGERPHLLDALDALADRHLGTRSRSGTIYVSRAGQGTRFAGESELERALERAGVKTFRPETSELREQLATYFRADRLIFAEGSALHALQLLGRGIGEVHIIRRRPTHGEGINAAFLQPRARQVVFHDLGPVLLHEHGPTGVPRFAKGLTVLDEDRLLAGFDGLGIPLRRHWDSPRYRSACDRDLREWLARTCTPQQRSIPGAAESLRTALDASGFGALGSLVDGAADPRPEAGSLTRWMRWWRRRLPPEDRAPP